MLRTFLLQSSRWFSTTPAAHATKSAVPTKVTPTAAAKPVTAATKKPAADNKTPAAPAKKNVSVKDLVAASVAAKQHSYSPYSKFRVGAAVVTKDGTVFPGTNVENASYGLAICAERSALVSAVSAGHKSFTGIAVASDIDEFIAPCGACRQFIREFGDVPLYLSKSSGAVKKTSAFKLLPESFGPADLDKERTGKKKSSSSSSSSSSDDE